MRTRSLRAMWYALVLLILASSGCQSVDRLSKAGRTEEQKQALVKPGMFGDNAPADRLRGRFDAWNEQVIREDAAVGTVFFGDSITEAWQVDVYFVPSGDLILNRGIGGDITPHMARRFEADVIQLKPRNVVILAGTNDVARLLGSKTDEQIIEQVMNNMKAMVESARKAGITVFVCSILPTNSDTKAHEGKARVLPQINKQLQALCEATPGCVYVDYASQMVGDQGNLRKDLARDGLHPHYAGYEIMARALKAAAAAKGLKL